VQLASGVAKKLQDGGVERPPAEDEDVAVAGDNKYDAMTPGMDDTNVDKSAAATSISSPPSIVVATRILSGNSSVARSFLSQETDDTTAACAPPSCSMTFLLVDGKKITS
jgi:hypothetical protein